MGNSKWEKVTVEAALTILSVASVGAGLWVIVGADHVSLAMRSPIGVGLFAVGCLFGAVSIGDER